MEPELTEEQKRIIREQLHPELTKEAALEGYAGMHGMSVEELKDRICLRMQELLEEGFALRQAAEITFKEWQQKRGMSRSN